MKQLGKNEVKVISTYGVNYSLYDVYIFMNIILGHRSVFLITLGPFSKLTIQFLVLTTLLNV